jgi:hypothetical protein
MNALPISDLTRSLAELLKEAYNGPAQDNSPTWFNDNDRNAGFFGQINPLTDIQASISADDTGNPGTTVASHTEHLRWSLANVNATLRGEPYQSNWSESWKVLTVTGQEWELLRKNLREEVDQIVEAIQKQEELQGPYLNGLLALIPHAAYHLATVRQIIERVKEKGI